MEVDLKKMMTPYWLLYLFKCITFVVVFLCFVHTALEVFVRHCCEPSFHFVNADNWDFHIILATLCCCFYLYCITSRGSLTDVSKAWGLPFIGHGKDKLWRKQKEMLQSGHVVNTVDLYKWAPPQWQKQVCRHPAPDPVTEPGNWGETMRGDLVCGEIWHRFSQGGGFLLPPFSSLSMPCYLFLYRWLIGPLSLITFDLALSALV